MTSKELLKQTLIQQGHSGNVGFGVMKFNKLEALEIFQEEGVPTPNLFYPDEGFPGPCVGRRSMHSRGRGMFICKDLKDYQRTRRLKRPPTHYLEWINPPLREFRVHVAFGKVIKLMDRPTGWYPGSGPAPEFSHKKTLRQVALDAVEALGMDFGAVDILWTQEKGFMVLEVNSGPDLKRSEDTLHRYVNAFINE